MLIAAGLLGKSGAPQPQGRPFTASMPSEGKANVDLGDGATLQIDESGSKVSIKDADGHTTDIWGDPHVNVDGKHVGDFYGTTTFELKDGTKITVNTEQSKSNPGVYYASDVVVTRGAQAVTISGVSEQTKGDLAISMGGNGYALDRANPDGLVLNQAAGGGWASSLTGRSVTQGDFDTTRPGAQALMQFGAEMGAALGLWLSFGTMTPILAAAVSDEPRPQQATRPLFGPIAGALALSLALEA